MTTIVFRKMVFSDGVFGEGIETFCARDANGVSPSNESDN
jgi:hypothetical protein